MGMDSFFVFLLIGVIFGAIGALMAFFITLEEYRKHFLGGNRAFKEAFRTAVVTFVVFVGLAMVVGFLFSKKIL